MKNFILLLFCCITSFSLNAQVALTIHGDVSDLLGEGVANVQINIYNGDLLMETVHTDDFGYYSYVVEDMPNEGTVAIEMIDCDDSSEFGIWNWTPDSTDIVQNFIFCEEPNNFCFAQIWGDSLNIQCDTLIQLYAAAEGVLPLTYIWSTGSTESEIYVGEPGCYGLTVTDAIGCIREDNKCVEFLENCCSATIIENATNSLEAIASGLAPFTYEWSNGGTGSFIDVIESGTYCVTITDATGCVANNCYYYEGPWNFCSAWIFQIGGNSLEASTSGIGPFTYEWSTGDTGQSIDVDETGTYCVAVIDATGCVANSCYYYNAGGIDSCSVELINTDSFCLFALATGVAPFSYEWEWSSVDSPEYCAGFFGTHCVTVTDATGCVASACYDFPLPFCNVDICEVEESEVIELHALPLGNGPFTYEWNTGETEEIITPTGSGNYCVTMTDATGCESSSCYYYNAGGIDTCSTQLIWHENVGCLQVFSEGVAPFDYEWNIEGCGNSNINCPHISGLYCVTVTDAAGCVSEACYEIDLDCGVQVFEPGAEPGILRAYPTGAEPFTYDWSTGETTSDIDPEEEGTYCVTLTDGTGCVTTDCYDYTTEPIDTFCFVVLTELEDGFCLQANAFGIAPFTYEWTNGGATNDVFCSDIAGFYCVTVTDAAGCVSENCAWIEGPNFCSTTIDSVMNNQTGELSLVAMPTGPGPYTYEWNNGSSDSSISPTEAGDYCVMVIDGFDCVSTSCYYYYGQNQVDSCYTVLNPLELGICLEASTYGNAPFSYLWSDGSTDSYVCATDTSGLYCVTVTDATGCVSEACGFVFNPNCFTYIDSTSTSGGQIQLSANTDGVGPFTYEWNTGSTEYAVIPVEEGTYCVTVTDAEDCISTSCYYYSIPCDPLFSVDIQFNVETGCLTAFTTGTGPFIYEWIFNGVSGPTICPNANTNYCVQVTNELGCVLTECFLIENIIEYGMIAGRIYTDTITQPVLSGTAYLIVYDSIAGTLTAVDTTSIINQGPGHNSYFFDGVPAGNYLVKVALDESSDDFEDYLPTYYGDVLFWDEAYFIGVPYDFFAPDIHMVAGENTGGPGFIGGLVIEGANFTGFADTRDGDGDPIANVLIILLDESGSPVKYTYTNEDGEYEFDNLPWGTYQVVVEILGFEQAIFEITIGPNDPVATNIIFEVDEDSVSSISTTIEDIIDVNRFNIFPNPTNGDLTIEMEMKANVEVFISLMSVDGRKVLETVKTVDYGMNRVDLDLSNFTNGVYFLNIVNGKDIISRKVILQKN